jgi:4a-hydroxytetrahydrobiopterin dehydratase
MTEDEVHASMPRVPGWELDGETLRREWSFASFADAVAFVVRLGLAAEAADHHPDITVSYRKVTLAFSTHSAGGLTERDFAGASEASRIAAMFSGPRP